MIGQIVQKDDRWGLRVEFICDGCKAPKLAEGVNPPREWIVVDYRGRGEKGIIHACSPTCAMLAIARTYKVIGDDAAEKSPA